MIFLIIVFILLTIVCFWRGNITLNDFPSPKIAYHYKIIGVCYYILGVIDIIIVIALFVSLFSGGDSE